MPPAHVHSRIATPHSRCSTTHTGYPHLRHHHASPQSGMSSGFVPSGAGSADTPAAKTKSDEEWRAARLEISVTAARKAETRGRDATTAQPSLYETLEKNRIAKQEAFEETHRLRNQFRSLQQDEIDFLDSILERTRAEEARIQKETLHGLQSFRQQQEAADQKAMNADVIGTSLRLEEVESWRSATRKRRRPVDKREILVGKKHRTSQPINEIPSIQRDISEVDLKKKKIDSHTVDPEKDPQAKSQMSGENITSTRPGLVDYGDDNDDW